ncbi:hypothetical protein [Bradyrhizobium sp.]|uniref:hypothetical protein n=1 Tax=Bradyrhizobium sp. TaxID=376 RepID=UPI003C378526
MPALFAYIVALVVLIGAGYEGLQWLAEPQPVVNHERVARENAYAKSKVAAERAEADPDPDSRDAEPRPGVVPPEPTGQAAAETRGDAGASRTAEETPAKAPGDVPRGGCMPIGITERGKLVFPMACQPILSQNRDNGTTPGPATAQSAPASTPAAKQAQTAAAPALTPTPKPNDPPATASAGANADARAETGFTTSDAARSGKEHADHGGVNLDASNKRKRIAEREPAEQEPKAEQEHKSSHPKGVMMILRTIEFPDGHREQRLLSMNQWRRSVYQDERW